MACILSMDRRAMQEWNINFRSFEVALFQTRRRVRLKMNVRSQRLGIVARSWMIIVILWQSSVFDPLNAGIQIFFFIRSTFKAFDYTSDRPIFIRPSIRLAGNEDGDVIDQTHSSKIFFTLACLFFFFCFFFFFPRFRP